MLRRVLGGSWPCHHQRLRQADTDINAAGTHKPSKERLAEGQQVA